jgi:hypothetical protein
VHPFRRRVRHLERDGAAHRVPEQNGLVDAESVEDPQQRLGQGRNVQDVVAALTAPVSGKVRDHVDPPSGQHARGGHQVLAGDREAVDVDDRYAGPTRAASAMDRRSAEVQALRHPTNVPRHGRIVSRARTGRPDPACNIAVGAVPASSPVDAPSGPRVLHLKRPPSTSRGRRSHRCGPTGLDRRVTDPDHGVAGPQDGARG